MLEPSHVFTAQVDIGARLGVGPVAQGRRRKPVVIRVFSLS